MKVWVLMFCDSQEGYIKSFGQIEAVFAAKPDAKMLAKFLRKNNFKKSDADDLLKFGFIAKGFIRPECMALKEMEVIQNE